jgi:hypothetical protein
MTSAIATAVAAAKPQIAAIQAQHLAWKRAKPIVTFYMNNIDQSPGLIYRGRINVRDLLAGYTFPTRANISSQGNFSVRASHYIAEWIASVPNDPNACKNIVVKVDMYGGEFRWSGIGHHWKAETKDGCDVLTFYINDDMQIPQFLLCPPNPLLPIPVFQFPMDWPEFGPGIWCINLLFLLNILRVQITQAVFDLIGDVINLPEDPFDIVSWADGVIDALNPQDWQVHILWTTSFVNDSSLWTILASRMNTFDDVIADCLDDGQLSLYYRRVFPDEGENPPLAVAGPVGLIQAALLTNNIANGACLFSVTDKSAFNIPLVGSFFTAIGAGVVNGAIRSVLTYTDGFVEDVLTPVTDDETLYPDEYWQSGFLGNFAAAPGICLRDSHWNDLQSAVNYSEGTAVTVVVGGDNPTADAIVKLLIESIGNLLGYFLLGGFDSLGDIADDVIQPFLNGTIAAWDTWTNTGRQTNLGWVHLWEVFQRGAENNSWSLTALAVLRGGFDATRPETSHTMVVDDRTWLIPGLHCTIFDRIMSTSGALQRMGIDLLFIDQIYEMNLVGGDDGAFSFQMKIGENKAALTAGERSARILKKALDAIQDIGVHLIS